MCRDLCARRQRREGEDADPRLPTRPAVAVLLLALFPVDAAHADILGLGGKCLDLADRKAASGTRVVLDTCTDSDTQQWTLADGKIVGPAGLCLEIKSGDRGGTDLAVISACGSAGENWSSVKGRIQGTGGKCLEARGDPEAESIPVVVAPCGDAVGQRWTFE